MLTVQAALRAEVRDHQSAAAALEQRLASTSRAHAEDAARAATAAAELQAALEGARAEAALRVSEREVKELGV